VVVGNSFSSSSSSSVVAVTSSSSSDSELGVVFEIEFKVVGKVDARDGLIDGRNLVFNGYELELLGGNVEEPLPLKPGLRALELPAKPNVDEG
jgi:hypothetical protein